MLMSAGPSEARLLDPVRRLVDTEFGVGFSDGKLLERFLQCRDQQAFATLVYRHGPMVHGVCRRIVGNAHDADDAFQATFLVLVRRGDTVQPRDMVGPWLYGVAFRTALAARHRAVRRLAREKPLDAASDLAATATTIPGPDGAWLELDRAIHRLPEIYRRPVVLCELLGTPRREAARLLGVAEGTLSSRLASARKRLARQLGGRSDLDSVAVGSLVLFPDFLDVAAPTALVHKTVGHVGAALGPAAAAIPATVAQLSQGVIRSMFITKFKTILASAALVGCLGGSAVILAGPREAPATIRDPQSPHDSQDQDLRDSRQRGQRQEAGANRAKDRPHRNQAGHEVIVGSGHIVTETLKISGVSSVNFTTAGKVTIKQTGREHLTITGDDNLLPLMDAKVNDGTLTLGAARKNVSIQPSNKGIEFVIEVKSLGHFDLRGAGDVQFMDFSGKELTINLMGAGNVTLGGKSSKLHLILAGAGDIRAESLTAKDAVVELRGAGNVTINATATLEANVRGAGNIEYIGSPKVKKTENGVGEVRPSQRKKKIDD